MSPHFKSYLQVNCCKLILTTVSINKLRFVYLKNTCFRKKRKQKRHSHFYNDNFKHENPTKETIIFPKPTTAGYMSTFYREKL